MTDLNLVKVVRLKALLEALREHAREMALKHRHPLPHPWPWEG